jgi:hypothetical protein
VNDVDPYLFNNIIEGSVASASDKNAIIIKNHTFNECE